MLSKIFEFRKNEDGAVTADWILLAGALFGLVMAVVATIQSGTNELANQTKSELQSQMNGSQGNQATIGGGQHGS